MYFCTIVFFANIFSEELTWTVEFVDRSRNVVLEGGDKWVMSKRGDVKF